jgi:hypothetical protein
VLKKLGIDPAKLGLANLEAEPESSAAPPEPEPSATGWSSAKIRQTVSEGFQRSGAVWAGWRSEH